MSADPSDHDVAFVVDDERSMRDIVSFALETQGFVTREFGTAEAAWRALRTEQPDLMVVDHMLPGASGIQLCSWVRAESSIPIIMLTARGESRDRIHAFEEGVDDYVVKPFHPRELALRAQALVRRAKAMRNDTLEVGPIAIRPMHGTVHVGGAPVHMTTQEYRLLVALASRPGEVLDFRQLCVAGWGTSYSAGSKELLKTSLYRLRIKLDTAVPGTGALLHSVRGQGYCLVLPDAPPPAPEARDQQRAH